MSSWISVNDRLPEPYEAVLICVGYEDKFPPYVTLGGYNHQKKEWETYTALDRKLLSVERVTHWMEKPDLPSAVKMNIFDKEETYTDCTVQVLTNSVTGETSVGWWHNDKNDKREEQHDDKL